MSKNKVFIDCGFYIGNATKIFQERGDIDKSWTIYAFEPYPKEDIQKSLDARLPLKVELIEKAVWVRDGDITFVIKGREDAHHVLFDSTLDRTTIVPVLDFSAFLKHLPAKAKIICSMDIEGSEFVVLPKLIEDGTIQRISWLDIEFHHRLMRDKTEQDAQDLIDQIEREGVKVTLKVPLI